MNASLLSELQARRSYPSVTVLANTGSTSTDDPARATTLRSLIDHADRRLAGDVGEGQRVALREELIRMADQAAALRSTKAVALCAAPGYAALVPIGTTVAERVVIDETFATRDLVADVNRTSRYLVATVSERRARMLVGDRHRLVELDGAWPLERAAGQGPNSWRRAVNEAVERACIDHQLPLVTVGVKRTVDRLLQRRPALIGTVHGNHDRTGWAALHTLAWPIVLDWLRTDRDRTLRQLDHARSTDRFACSLGVLWPMALDGRIELLAVEAGFSVAARLEAGTIVPADDREAPDVIDDIVDELIEQVMRSGGRAVLLPDGDLASYDRIAGTLRF